MLDPLLDPWLILQGGLSADLWGRPGPWINGIGGADHAFLGEERSWHGDLRGERGISDANRGRQR